MQVTRNIIPLGVISFLSTRSIPLRSLPHRVDMDMNVALEHGKLTPPMLALATLMEMIPLQSLDLGLQLY